MNSFHVSQIKSYLLAGRLLHLITVLEVVLIILVVPRILHIQTHGSIGLLMLKIYLAGYIFSLPVFSQLDARSRYQNYKQIKDQFYLYGFHTRILMPVLKSRCQRDAALVSAKELGLHDPCSRFFKEQGYRWYHLLPDFVFRKPQFLITRYFWQTTFFAPVYQPKIDFSKIGQEQLENRFNVETIYA